MESKKFCTQDEYEKCNPLLPKYLQMSLGKIMDCVFVVDVIIFYYDLHFNQS